jgi:hypothetical protein
MAIKKSKLIDKIENDDWQDEIDWFCLLIKFEKKTMNTHKEMN